MKLRQLEIGILMLLVLGLATIGYAFFAYEQVTVDNTVKSLTAATYQNANRAFATLEDGKIYFTFDGITTPTTAGVGHPLEVGQNLILDNVNKVRNFRAIRGTSTSGKLKIHYWQE